MIGVTMTWDDRGITARGDCPRGQMSYILSTHSGNTVQTQKPYALHMPITMGKWRRVQKPDFILTNNSFQKIKTELRDPNTPPFGDTFVINSQYLE